MEIKRQDEHHYMLRKDVNRLGTILGQVLKEHGGEELFNEVEEIREMTKELRRNHNDADHKKLKEKVHHLQSPMRKDVIRAFSIYFYLVNIAEQNHRIRRSRSYRLKRGENVQPSSIEASVKSVKEAGYSKDILQKVLDDSSIELIITAHPTEATKRTILEIQKRISSILQQQDNMYLTEKEWNDLDESLVNEVTALWQTDELRHRKPTVIDEVKNGLYYFDQTLFDVLPAVHQELEEQFEEYYPNEEITVPNFIHFGSWIGGDRDGNPFVTTDVTWQTLNLQRDLVLRKYDEALTELMKRFSQSTTRVDVDPEFISAMEKYEKEYLRKNDTWPIGAEVYRRYFQVVLKRLAQVGKGKIGYDDPEELLEDLRFLRKHVLRHQMSGQKLKKLNKVIRQVELFGFHLATLDIRNHSGEHETALTEMLRVVHMTEDYSSLSEDEKIDMLQGVLKDPRPLMLLNEDYSKETQNIFNVFKTIKAAHDEFGPRSIDVYLVSMTQSASDLLEVLVLAKEAGIYRLHADGSVESNLNVAPLLETVEDLIAGPKIMKRLFELDVYRDHLTRRNNHQEIMLGYSDGSKDGGTLTANWKLFNAQLEIHNMAREYDVRLKFFHGRGGSLGRGGGPLNRAIASQPGETLGDGVKITEQGEVLSSRYLLGDIAFRNLEQAASALLSSSARVYATPGEGCDVRQTVWEEAMEEISEQSLKKYQGLVFGDKDFLTYFKQTTPLNELKELNIGSRPMSRKGSERFEDLRAIPWVFAWTQCRQMLPAWYAAGTGLASFAEKGEENVKLLQEMYENWPFFQSTINNLQMALMKADMFTAKEYVNLVKDEEIGQRIFADIQDEFERTKEMLLLISKSERLLDYTPNIQDSVHLRNPYVDPLNYLQVDLIQKMREENGDHSDELMTEVLLTISGVAAGLLNTG
ncbi:phosphoenolpyruvate carboxylase [Salisediminibacterium halotolerans]|uniref:phosphoenolpyruvate carboxylase n=1 Tax=Salisediminibacterium halotolerans TaxID=517425 RepID=UPI000EABAEBB|nr:phosphoenolpyruvate carboxylase [Salisediminibacterium halotolerans]RLJ75566.1 phosphoenolpyruvate carboxylase type 1 [Actinophytocola xinjiangensis]RPE89419.1 phosphoenolpyruvate carboxylase type 1 [Salisediminibacterium halotolerans]TWG36179.1 phosphoenolpyruvate carboxylase type 1 [Salisediminibacterium halotolerans]GEL08581.1 phosphoenolpyruvate carboxylase [Salisediminibacterium halotolerans]